MKYLNLTLLILFPIAWFAPLLRAALLPWFGMDEISVVSGLQSLWETDPALALLVTFLAIFAPYAKTIGLALIHWHLLKPSTLPVLHTLGKLAMADVFLIALCMSSPKASATPPSKPVGAFTSLLPAS